MERLFIKSQGLLMFIPLTPSFHVMKGDQLYIQVAQHSGTMLLFETICQIKL